MKRLLCSQGLDDSVVAFVAALDPAFQLSALLRPEGLVLESSRADDPHRPLFTALLQTRNTMPDGLPTGV